MCSTFRKTVQDVRAYTARPRRKFVTISIAVRRVVACVCRCLIDGKPASNGKRTWPTRLPTWYHSRSTKNHRLNTYRLVLWSGTNAFDSPGWQTTFRLAARERVIGLALSQLYLLRVPEHWEQPRFTFDLVLCENMIFFPRKIYNTCRTKFFRKK